MENTRSRLLKRVFFHTFFEQVVKDWLKKLYICSVCIIPVLIYILNHEIAAMLMKEIALCKASFNRRGGGGKRNV